MEPVIEIDRVSKSFPGPPPVDVLHDLSFTVDAGAYVSIVGPSGSGKSTLLNILGLIDEPTSGRYRLEGVETTDLGETQRTALRGHRIGFVFQDFHLLAGRTAAENVALGELYLGRDRQARLETAVDALRRVGLGHRVGARVETMSGGERQRVAIARALTGQPALLLCDEPTGNLDTHTASDILDMFDALHDDGTTLIVITHDHATAARANRQLQIVDGRLQHPVES